MPWRHSGGSWKWGKGAMGVTSPGREGARSLPARDVRGLLDGQAARLGERAFLCCQPAGGTLTYDGLARGAWRVGNLLHALGVARGDRVAVLGAAQPETVLAFFGALALGATVVVPACRGDGPELLTRARARVLLTTPGATPWDPWAFRPAFREVVMLGTGTAVVEHQGARPGHRAGAEAECLDGVALLAGAPETPVAALLETPPAPGDTALLVAGEEAVTPISQAQLLALAQRLGSRYQLSPGQHCLGLLGLDSLAGLVAMLFTTFFMGGTLVLSPSRSSSIPRSNGGVHQAGWVLGTAADLSRLASEWADAPVPSLPFRLALWAPEPGVSRGPARVVSRLAMRVERLDLDTGADSLAVRSS